MLLAIGDCALDALLAQDAPTGDLTTHALGIGRQLGRITFAARADMVLCCVEEAARMIQYQQAYQAAAKMLQTAQSMMDTLLQLGGR